jgi:hypothetical protein
MRVLTSPRSSTRSTCEDVDLAGRDAPAPQERLRELALAPGEGEDRAMVITVAVDVEQAHASRPLSGGPPTGRTLLAGLPRTDEGLADPPDPLGIPTLGDVRHGEEQRGAHTPGG